MMESPQTRKKERDREEEGEIVPGEKKHCEPRRKAATEEELPVGGRRGARENEKELPLSDFLCFYAVALGLISKERATRVLTGSGPSRARISGL